MPSQGHPTTPGRDPVPVRGPRGRPAPYGGVMSETAAPSSQQEAADLVARAARAAQRSVAGARREIKDAVLCAMADHLVEAAPRILAANGADLERARAAGMRAGLVDRLALTPERIGAIADSLREIAALPDPVGEIVDGRTLPNGLRVRRVRVPLGVMGMIYEARPNVTVDVAALTLKSGNAVVLRGGSAAEKTNAAIVDVLRGALSDAALPADLVATIDSAGRAGAAALMRARGLIDVLVPRGGAGLIRAVVEQSAIFVFAVHMQSMFVTEERGIHWCSVLVSLSFLLAVLPECRLLNLNIFCLKICSLLFLHSDNGTSCVCGQALFIGKIFYILCDL